MQVGLIGLGRMGRVLARRLSDHVELTVFDRNADKVTALQEELGVKAAGSMEELAALGIVILAVPDPEVISCIKDFNQMRVPMLVLNIATNVTRLVLEQTAAKHIRCVGVKFVAHAREMALGQDPVIIVDASSPDITALVTDLFAPVGQVTVGKADIVSFVNTIAVEKALEAAVYIEEGLRQQGVTDPVIVKSALRQVAAGVLKAFADDDLGPFARQVVRAVRAKMRK